MRGIVISFAFAVFCTNLHASPDWSINGGINYISEGNNYYKVWVNNDAELNMSGGYATYIFANNYSTVDIVGGEIYKVEAKANSKITVSSGIVDELYCGETSVVNVHGWSNASSPISSDCFHIVASQDSVVNLFEGNVAGQLNAYGNSKVHIYGTNLVFTPQYLRGTWSDGTNFTFYVRGQFELPPQFIFHTIPEPATMLLLGLGGLLIRRRK